MFAVDVTSTQHLQDKNNGKIRVKLTLCRPETPLTGSLTDSEVPDEMPQYAAFHQGLHCLLGQN